MPLLDTRRYTLYAKKGFTLIELLVVIAIIGILATFVVASFTSAQQRGRDARRKSDLDAIKKALELAKQDSVGGSRYRNGISAAILVPDYIKAVPADPVNTGANVYNYVGIPCSCTDIAGAGPWCTDFRIIALLENAGDPQATDGPASGSTFTQCPSTGLACASAIYTNSTNHYVVCAP